ncbi:MAG TPA: hypothetical protein VD927_01540 [Chryseosolibacter sp.]|nr:hypothetical protein [Chryseosolibacter sp.]
MATERDLELLDDYLGNRLKGEEKTSFEQRLQADPELQGEMQLQQHMISGIRNARAAELKAMLNNIPLSGISQGGASVAAKFAMGGLIAGAVITGVYFLSKEEPKEVAPATEKQIPATSDSNQDATSSIEEETKKEPETIATESKPIVARPKAKQPVKDSQATTEVTQPQIEVFDPTEEAEGTGSHVNQTESKPATTGKAEPSVTVSVDKSHRDFGFHYQFKDEKLFLYGPFERNLYEIMEFFSDEKRTIFLYYKDSYYLLKEDGSEIKPLKEIADPILLRKLNESRGK